jgi:hypothetical protein
MTHHAWHWALSNVGPQKLLVWLEPWAEEIEVPSGSTIALRVEGKESTPVEIESTADHIVVWASAGQTARVYIDDREQESASASLPVPGGFEGSTKELLNMMFDGQLYARLGGQDIRPEGRSSWWRRARRRLGF